MRLTVLQDLPCVWEAEKEASKDSSSKTRSSGLAGKQESLALRLSSTHTIAHVSITNAATFMVLEPHHARVFQ